MKIFEKTMKIKCLQHFTSPVLGNAYPTKVAVVEKAYGEKLIAGGFAKEDDGKDEQEVKTPVNASAAAKELAEKEGLDLSLVKGTGQNGSITVTDVKKYLEENTDEVTANEDAIKLAEENGVDLADVTGTGEEGAITLEDVQAFIDDNKE